MSSETTLIDGNIRPDSVDKVLFANDFASTLDKKNENIEGAPSYVNGNAIFLKQSFRRQQPEWAKGDGAFLIMRTAFIHSKPPSAIQIRRRNIVVDTLLDEQAISSEACWASHSTAHRPVARPSEESLGG
jgi:hypothetical protein